MSTNTTTDFNINLYEERSNGGAAKPTPDSSIVGGNSSTSIVCATLTNITEGHCACF